MSTELSEIKLFYEALKALKSQINKETAKTGQISKKGILTETERISSEWFNKIKGFLIQYSINEILIEEYNIRFVHLLKLSTSAGNSKSAFLDDLNKVLVTFKNDVILAAQISGTVAPSTNGELEKLLAQIQDPTKSDYLTEAINCAKSNYLRASIVMGWCAAIDHIHRKIEDHGFIKFNIASVTMSAEAQGRFKRFNKTFNVLSLSELRGVFDDDILWVIEGMKFIDLNQHTRLRACFDMRNQCGHPGEAPITMYNLMSFFSDINEILFKNPTFAVLDKENV